MRTDISIVLDRSGSMDSVKGATIEGYNKFLSDQKAVEGEASITLAQFDDVYEIVYSGKDIQDAPLLTNETFQPRSMTALLDAIGKTINDTGARLDAFIGKPDKVVFVILTDGEENASREFSKEQINRMISHQTDNYSWEFVFLGANQDAIATARGFGINANNAMTYASNDKGSGHAYDSIGANMSAFRTGKVETMAFSADDRKKQEDSGASH